MKRSVLWATAALVTVNIALVAAILVRSLGGRPATTVVVANSTVEVASATGGQPGVYAVTGVVKELKADGSNLVIRHEAIPGYMMAMTMPFRARDPREIASVKAGDQLTFRLLVTDDESWIDSVKRVGAGEAPAPFSYEQARIVRDVDPLNPGDLVPDYPFTNQLGRAVKFGELRGQAIGVTFVFTRCPLPEFCPRMLKNFSAVDAALRGSGQPTNVHLVALTIDPLFDTPAVLQSTARQYQFDPARVSLWTGALIDVDALTEQVGLVYRRQNPTALPDHNVRTLVIDRQGRLRKVIVGNTWKPEELVDDLTRAARSEP